MADVSVVVVHYDTPDLLHRCLDALERGSGELSIETFVIDNASPGFDVERERTSRPQVTWLANTTNVGFATASNQALRLASGRYLLLLNPDAFLRPDTLPTMVAYLDATPISAAAPPGWSCRMAGWTWRAAARSRRRSGRSTG